MLGSTKDLRHQPGLDLATEHRTRVVAVAGAGELRYDSRVPLLPRTAGEQWTA